MQNATFAFYYKKLHSYSLLSNSTFYTKFAFMEMKVALIKMKIALIKMKFASIVIKVVALKQIVFKLLNKRQTNTIKHMTYARD